MDDINKEINKMSGRKDNQRKKFKVCIEQVAGEMMYENGKVLNNEATIMAGILVEPPKEDNVENSISFMVGECSTSELLKVVGKMEELKTQIIKQISTLGEDISSSAEGYANKK